MQLRTVNRRCSSLQQVAIFEGSRSMTADAIEGAQRIQTVGIVGGGLIGLSWASLFLAHNLEVIVYDPQPTVEAEVKPFVESAWVGLRNLGLPLDPFVRFPRFTSQLEDLAGVDFVQENGPDRVAIKRNMLADLERVVRADIAIASSTSSLTASEIQAGATHPERIFVAHPMNPPHIVPLVELVAGQQTAPHYIDLAEALYQRVKRVTIRVRKEVVGHVANRLTSALYREAVYLAASGIASVEDVDKAMSYGPGLRWALVGPHLTYHLGGGKGGYRHYLDHLGPTQERRWEELGTVALTDGLKEQLVAGVDAELKHQDEQTLVMRRDIALAEILMIKRTYGF
jgi:carnitine 3-dehydrogenase